MILWTSPSLNRPEGRQLRVSWEAFEARCSSPKPGETKAGLARWAPVEFRQAYRCRANVVRAHAVVIDIEDGSGEETIVRSVEGLHYLLHSTFSATSDLPRWRLVVDIDRSVTAEEYERLWRWLASAVEREGCTPDYAARDSSRAWAVPAIPPSGHYVCRVGHGPSASVADGLAAIPEEESIVAPKPSMADGYDARVRRARSYVDRMDPAIQGSGGSTQTLKVAIVLARGFALEPDDALALLAEYNARCQPAWSARELEHKVRQAIQRSRLPYGYLL